MRADGRRAGELRRLVVQCGIISSPAIDGSSLYQQGNTRVLCCVSGPRELSERRREDSAIERESAKVVVELSTAAFAGSTRRAKRRVDRRQTEMSLLIKQSLTPLICCHLFPNSEIAIALDVLHDDGGALPCAVNAATLALLNAGIPLQDVLIATQIAFIPPPPSSSQAQVGRGGGDDTVAYADGKGGGGRGGKEGMVQPVLLLDPPLHEVGGFYPSVQVGVGCVSGRVSFVLSGGGQLPVSALEGAVQMAMEAGKKIQRELNEEMRKYSQSTQVTRGHINA